MFHKHILFHQVLFSQLQRLLIETYAVKCPFCGTSKAKHNIRNTLSVILLLSVSLSIHLSFCLSQFAFAGPACILQNTGFAVCNFRDFREDLNSVKIKPMQKFPSTGYSIICLLRLLCIPNSCLIRPKIPVPIIFPYTSMLKTPLYYGSCEFRIRALSSGP